MANIKTLKKFPGYQTDYENSWWQTVEVWYGKNPKDTKDFSNLLTWAIRSQDPKADNETAKEEVQRLNGSGS